MGGHGYDGAPLVIAVQLQSARGREHAGCSPPQREEDRPQQHAQRDPPPVNGGRAREALLVAPVLDLARVRLERAEHVADFSAHKIGVLGGASARRVDRVRVFRPEVAPRRGHDVMRAGHGDNRA